MYAKQYTIQQSHNHWSSQSTSLQTNTIPAAIPNLIQLCENVIPINRFIWFESQTWSNTRVTFLHFKYISSNSRRWMRLVCCSSGSSSTEITRETRIIVRKCIPPISSKEPPHEPKRAGTIHLIWPTLTYVAGCLRSAHMKHSSVSCSKHSQHNVSQQAASPLTRTWVGDGSCCIWSHHRMTGCR